MLLDWDDYTGNGQEIGDESTIWVGSSPDSSLSGDSVEFTSQDSEYWTEYVSGIRFGTDDDWYMEPTLGIIDSTMSVSYAPVKYYEWIYGKILEYSPS